MIVKKKQINFNIRYNLGKYQRYFHIPNLINIQKKSYAFFLQEYIDPQHRKCVGLQAVFKSVFPIRDYNEISFLDFLEYCLEPPKYNIKECKSRGIVYSSSLKVKMKLVLDYSKKKVKQQHYSLIHNLLVSEKYIYYGEVPKMTKYGTFIINGTERVIVSQLHRSPGICFEKVQIKTCFSNINIYTGRIIPYRGSWLDFEFDSKNILYCRIDKKRKFYVSILLKALGYDIEDMFDIFYKIDILFITRSMLLKSVDSENLLGSKVSENIIDAFNNIVLKTNSIYTPKSIEKLKAHNIEKIPISNSDLFFFYSARNVFSPKTNNIILNINENITQKKIQEIRSMGILSIKIITIDGIKANNFLRNTLMLDKIQSQEEAILEVYKKIRPNDPPTLEIAENLIYNLFFNKNRYNLSEVGRLKINYKLKLEISLKHRTLTHKDIISVIKYLINLKSGRGVIDDIDNLGNRRVRPVGELVKNQYRTGLIRMEKAIHEKMCIQTSNLITVQDLVNCKPLTAVIKEFFRSSQLSQFIDQTNPLSEITHKRRLSALGPGGLTRDRAGFKVRDIHLTHYGRICPIETPEGPNIGLIASLASFAKINKYGFIETPYRKISNAKLTGKIVYYSALEEENEVIAQCSSLFKFQSTNTIITQVRQNSETLFVAPQNVTLMDISSNQLVSIAAGLIPFLEHNDANRALMGSNMQRQAIPLLVTESPLVGTGIEPVFSRDSEVCKISRYKGVVRYVDSLRIIIQPFLKNKIDELSNSMDIYRLVKYQRTNQDTCFNQKSIAILNNTIKEKEIIADGPSIKNGELALGKNIIVAFMPWHGYNFEDSILISEKLIKNNLYTSIHIEEYELISRDTKLGPEEITRDIPNTNEDTLQKLNSYGIVKIGACINPGDILIGKVTPKGETQLSPEEKLIKAIFGDKAGDVQDTSLRMPPGSSGVVIYTKSFYRKNFTTTPHFQSVKKMEQQDILNTYKDECTAIIRSHIKDIFYIIKNEQISNTFSNKNIEIKINEKLRKKHIKYLSWYDYKSIKFKQIKKNIWLSKKIKILEKQLKETYSKFCKKVFWCQDPEELSHGIIALIKVRIAISRKLQPGDKMAGRHGNKGVVSKVLVEEDMPYLEDGTVVDIVLNPLGVPSRMNVGQVLETYLGWAMRNIGCHIKNLFMEKKYNEIKYLLKVILYKESTQELLNNFSFKDLKKIVLDFQSGLPIATPVFNGISENQVKKFLSLTENSLTGQAVLFDGRSGACFEQSITIGIMYILKLHHLVDEKLHARSVGPYSLVTQQPLGGKAQFGGQRLGEMEVWALEGYGAAYALQEFLTVKSDDVTGRTKMYESIIKGDHTLESSVPESFNVLMKELQSLGLDIQLFEDIDNSIKEKK